MKYPLFFGILTVAASLHAQQPLRLSGSTTVVGALEPRQRALEQAVGRPLQFAGTGTFSGLVSLTTGAADVAMLSTPLPEVADAINHRTPGRIDPATLRAERIGEVRIIFIVNPHNPVRAVSAAQLVDMLDGKVTNWKAVGGPDLPIIVVALANGGPLLQEQLLGGKSITDKARGVANAVQIAPIVAAERGAIGIISSAHPRGQTSVLQTDAKVVAPLFLVTRGDAPPDAAKLVEAARRLLGTSS